MSNIVYDKEEKMYYFSCPHCDGPIQVPLKDIRCTIFRHAVYKKDGRPILPHSKKELCDSLAEQGLVYGCAKPFTFNGASVVKCDYI